MRNQAAFFHDIAGSVMLMIAFASMAIIGATGVAVDIGRSQMVQAKLQNAVDAAGLAAGATLSTNDLTDVATKYVALNFNNGTLDATVTHIGATLSADKKTLTVTASAQVPTTVMKIFGENSVAIAATSELTRSNKGLELALVLDTTGSMAGSKLASLKSASHALVNILFGDTQTQDNLWIGVVPFSQAVNIGPSRSNWLNASHYASLDWGSASWAGCVDARYAAGRDVTDDPPYDLAASGATVPNAPYERLKAYYWADDANNNWIGSSTNNNIVCNKKSSCVCGTTYVCSCVTFGLSTTCTSCNGSGSNRTCTATTTTTTYTITGTKGPNTYCPSALTPLTNVKANVDTGIDALVARGNTHINLGAVWGWRLISPRWRGYWGGTMNSNNLPLDYNAPLMSKAVVIMTDGENTMSSTVRSAYGYLGDGYLGTTQSATAVTRLNSKLSTVCTAMKAQGITVYTILFEESSGTIANLLKNCASNPDYFFNSPTEDALHKAFQAIGDSLANLRISK